MGPVSLAPESIAESPLPSAVPESAVAVVEEEVAVPVPSLLVAITVVWPPSSVVDEPIASPERRGPHARASSTPQIAARCASRRTSTRTESALRTCLSNRSKTTPVARFLVASVVLDHARRSDQAPVVAKSSSRCADWAFAHRHVAKSSSRCADSASAHRDVAKIVESVR